MTSPQLPADRALAYSPLSFLRDRRDELVEHVELTMTSALDAGDAELVGDGAAWLWRRLAWDSDHFGLPMIRIDAAFRDEAVAEPVAALAASLRDLIAVVRERFGRSYLFAELPADETDALQALGRAGFGLVETRPTYFTAEPTRAVLPERWGVREAASEDTAHLREVAATARNPYDRYHADPFFGEEVADAYLATYAEASIGGMASAVLVPDPGDGRAPGAFFTATLSTPPACPLGLHHACSLDIGLGRIPLVAVGPDRSGWHVRLLSETTRYLAERGADVVVMGTQAANGAVIHNCEKLGFRLGRVSHVLSMEVADVA